MERFNSFGLGFLANDSEFFDSLKEYIFGHENNVVPGYQYNYHHTKFHYIEFYYRYDGKGARSSNDNLDIHFSTNSKWSVFYDSTIDTNKASHLYNVKTSKDSEYTFPMRIICPDTLPALVPGCELYGQPVAYAERITFLSGNDEDAPFLHVIEGNKVSISGKILNVIEDSAEVLEHECSYFEIEVDTPLGFITVVAQPNMMDKMPREGDIIDACAVVAMDLALESKEKPEGPFYVPVPYPPLTGDEEIKRYGEGFYPTYNSAALLISDSIISGRFNRLSRGCADEVTISHYEGIEHIQNRSELPTALIQNLPKKSKECEILHIVSGPRELLGKTVVYSDTNSIAVCYEVNEDGFISKLLFVPDSIVGLAFDNELHLITILADVFCGASTECLKTLLSKRCVYYSDFSGKQHCGSYRIIDAIDDVKENLSTETQYTSEVVKASEEVCGDDILGIYKGNWCIRLYQGILPKLVAVVFIKHNNARITNIFLSTSKQYLKSFADSCESSKQVESTETSFTKTDDLLKQAFGTENTLYNMRQNTLFIPDDEGAYVWQEADDYITDWFRSNSYKVNSTDIFDDCLGYSCTRNGVEYAVFVYAYGKKKTAMLDGDYCAKLRNLELSQGKTILVIYLHVTYEENEDGAVTYFTGMYNSKDKAPEVWELSWIGEKSAFIFYPRKEMMDLSRRLSAAYNSMRLDILQNILLQDATIEQPDGGQVMNDAVFSNLAYLRKTYGLMKTAYIRFNDVLFCKVAVLEDYCYVHFSVSKDNRIACIKLSPLDERYRELIVTDETIMSEPIDCVPNITDVDLITATEHSRFSALLKFENGETRRYDAPIDKDNTDSVIEWRKYTFTDKIFSHGRLSSSIAHESSHFYSAYTKSYPGIEFPNGASISTVELYHNSYPVGSFKYNDGPDVFEYDGSSGDDFAVGRLYNLDPSNPLYLFDKKRHVATVLPEQYQDTQIICYPFCGGFSEGLVMVSTMGELDLRYHHNMMSCAGMWGWLDTNLNTVIEPKYIYAKNFIDGRAIVCKGEWSIIDEAYWCNNEQWGVIDTQENEIVPCQFDEIYEIDGTDRLFFVHEGGWDEGHYSIFDTAEKQIILALDFDFDKGYMFNELFVDDKDILVFVDHLPGQGEDKIYAYDLHEKKWLIYCESYTERTYNGQKSVVVNKDGKDIIVF